MSSTKIPFSTFNSWMHPRKEIPKISSHLREEKYNTQSMFFRVADAIISRIFIRLGFKKPIVRWTGFRVVMKLCHIWFKIANNLEVHGQEHIPATGAIFYMNHLGSMDPLILEGISPHPFGFFTAIGESWIADAMEVLYGFVTRQGSKEEMIEKMIRAILTKNRFFAIWPEGILGREKLVVQGFSSIIPVYATVNAHHDRIPFVPVLIQGSDCYNVSHPTFRLKKIRVDLFPPIIFPRQWLAHPDEGGKTPRELMDFLMLELAHKAGQKNLGINYRLEHRKKSNSSPQKPI